MGGRVDSVRHGFQHSAGFVDRFGPAYFSDNGIDGNYPIGSLVQSGSLLYGVTNQGGTGGQGVLYSLNTSSSNAESIIHPWTGSATEGARPESGPVLVGSVLYGTTSQGATGGTIYAYNTSSHVYSTAYFFNNANATNDGESPYGGLTAVGSMLYGLTVSGGTNSRGTLYQFNPATGAEQVLYDFNDNSIGDYPMGSLLQNGPYLYGFTSQDATGSASGSLFAFNTQSGSMSQIADFAAGQPVGSLILSGTTLYGVTAGGGSHGDGSLFSVATLPLPVPEPGTLGVALASILGVARRRRVAGVANP